ncbi:MAG: hypothetical protein H5T78_02975 [Nocardia sp.]|nr:hypothetical protein [Nocardia sp.]
MAATTAEARKAARLRAAEKAKQDFERLTAVTKLLEEYYVLADTSADKLTQAEQRRDEAIARAQAEYDKATATLLPDQGAVVRKLKGLGLTESELVDKLEVTASEVRKLLRAADDGGDAGEDGAPSKSKADATNSGGKAAASSSPDAASSKGDKVADSASKGEQPVVTGDSTSADGDGSSTVQALDDGGPVPASSTSATA